MSASRDQTLQPHHDKHHEIRLENIEYQHPQTWGWKPGLKGKRGARIRYLTFKNVTIAGERLDAAYLNDPTKFDTSFVSDSIFK